jgi:eukaryotic-like serine/threonine-protein kinase
VSDNLVLVGKTISHYQVLERIGGGGMGVVYKAQDIRLGRLVALKMLPPHLAEDPIALQRLRREAQAASNLNHPNICTIYDIDDSAGLPFIVMEYLEGKPLRQHISGKPLDNDELIRFSTQIADALIVAHDKGIIHRDITSGNIFVAGKVLKILDFGLAKPRDAALFSPPASQAQFAPTVAAPLTTDGSTLGTVSYMSPEQALGDPVDHRTDLFSLGVVLYEMATGVLPFTGRSAAAIFDAILHKEPSAIRALNPGVSPAFEEVVAKALKKSKEDRYQHALDLLNDLQTLSTGHQVPVAVSRLPVRIKNALLWSAAAAMLILVGLLLTRFRVADNPSLLKSGNALFTQLTNAPGAELSPAISPDGKTFAFSKGGDIFVQRVAGQIPLNITNAPQFNNDMPMFSPDGSHIVFRSEREGGGIFVIGATGESVTRLTDLGYDPSWSPSGKEIIFATQRGDDPSNLIIAQSKAWILNVGSGARRQIALDDVLQPRWSPHGHRIAYWKIRRDGPITGERHIWTARFDGSDARAVTDDRATNWDPMWSPDGGFLYFSSDRGGNMNLWRVPIDEATGQTRGPAEPITTGGTASRHSPTLSSDGRNIVYVEQLEGANIYKVGFDPLSEKLQGSPEPVTRGNQLAAMPAPSPDGKLLAFWLGGKQEDIAIVSKDGQNFRKLTDDAYRDRFPRWSPDGKEIAFYSDRSGNYEVWAVRPDGGGLRPITHTGSRAAHMAWSPDGNELVYCDASNQLMSIDPHKDWTEQTPKPVADGMVGSQPVWSPDGRQLLCLGRLLSNASSEGVLRYERRSNTVSKILDFGFGMKWLSDSERILVSTPDAIHLFNLRTKKQRELMKVQLDAFATFDISTDNRTIYFSQRLSEGDVWLISLK